MVNNVVLIGRLTRDPELRKTPNGASVTNFTVAVNRNFQSQQDADFIRCVAWRQTADFLTKYATKGALVSVEGRIETGSYQDQDGKTVYTTDVVANSVQLLESRAVAQERQAQMSSQSFSQPQGQGYYQDNQPQSFTNDAQDSFEEEFEGPELDISSDDLPF